MRGQCGYRVGLFLEDEGGEEGDDLFWGEFGEDILEDEFRQDKLVCRVDLWQTGQWTRGMLVLASMLTSQATFPLSSTREFWSTNPRSFKTSMRCS